MESQFKELQTALTRQIILTYVSDSDFDYLSCCVLNTKIYIIYCTINFVLNVEFELRVSLRKGQ